MLFILAYYSCNLLIKLKINKTCIFRICSAKNTTCEITAISIPDENALTYVVQLSFSIYKKKIVSAQQLTERRYQETCLIIYFSMAMNMRVHPAQSARTFSNAESAMDARANRRMYASRCKSHPVISEIKLIRLLIHAFHEYSTQICSISV